MSLDAGDFDYVCALLRKQAGVELEPGKEYLVETRLKPVVRLAGCQSLPDLMSKLRGRQRSPLHVKVVEAMMTNETQFFRDGHPFEALRTMILPSLVKERLASRELNFWCAAASTGQEPYSLAMLIADSFPQLADWNIRITASDYSEDVLQRARSGRFQQLEVDRGLPKNLLEKYFTKQGAQWQISDPIRQRVEFSRINLVDHWPMLPQMDLIMMRNVLIYFSAETKKAILAKVQRVLKRDGYLILGSAETTLNLDPAFEQVFFGRSVCYRLKAS